MSDGDGVVENSKSRPNLTLNVHKAIRTIDGDSEEYGTTTIASARILSTSGIARKKSELASSNDF